MKRKIPFLGIVFLLIFLAMMNSVKAQDIHFSQYAFSPLNLNPGMTGFYNGNYRFHFNNRTQWKAVTVPYSTTSISAEMLVKKRELKQDIISAGLIINRDKAGDSEFGTTQLNLSIAYAKPINSKNNQFISIGLQPGIAQRTINYTKLTFDNQFNGSSYDPNLPNQEQFDTRKFIFFDLGAGIYWDYIFKKNLKFDAGIALFHLNNPKQTLLGNTDIKLDKKLTIFGNAEYAINNRFDIMPSFMYLKQGPYNEFDLGATVRFVKERSRINYTAINAGIFFRMKDAAFFNIGLDYKNCNLSVSYDINYSNLKPASNSRGGLEIALRYIINNASPIQKREVPCMIF